MPGTANASARPAQLLRDRVSLPWMAGAFSLGFLWFILCRHLSNEWSANEQYSYGWFVPFFAAYLFWLRWEDVGKLESRKSKVESSERVPRSALRAARAPFLLSTFYFLLLFLLLPLRLFEVGNPDWRPLGWLHAFIVVLLTLGLVYRIGGTPGLRHFAFPISFILIAVPWISPVEAPLVQGLMRVVATTAAETLALCGIPAQLEGSVIRINSGVVGVSEACSGVRSLQTSLMIGLLFGELKRLSVTRRLLLLIGAVGIAFAANCARAFFLVWIASSQGVAAVGKWHDLAGYLILGVVFLGTVAFATVLERTRDRSRRSECNDNKQSEGNKNAEINSSLSDLRPVRSYPRLLPTSCFIISLAYLLFVEAAVELWYRSSELKLVQTATWEVTWPEANPGFRALDIDQDVRATLRFDRGREAIWPIAVAGLPNESMQKTTASCSMFFFRWEPGRTSILRARAHRPDICLPNTGWHVTEDHGVRSYEVRDGIEMPFRHFSFARPAAENRETVAHAFFCQREDRIPREEINQFNLTAGGTSDWTRSDRLRVVLQGLRNQGQQVLELILITPRPFDAGAAEAEFAKLVPQIVKVGDR